MKTALQEFIENNFYKNETGEWEFKFNDDTEMTDEINEALRKEKDQIKNDINYQKEDLSLKSDMVSVLKDIRIALSDLRSRF